MRKLFHVLICLLLLAGVLLAQSGAPASVSERDAARLIGTWEGHTPDGMSATISFRDDSNMTFSPGATVDFVAQPQGNELVATVAVPGVSSQLVRIRAEGDRLTYTAIEAPAQQWVRVGKAVAGQPAYVGKWAIDPFAPVQVDKKKKKKRQEDFPLISSEVRTAVRLVITPEGKVRLRLPVRTDFGAFNVQGNKIIMQYGGKVWVAAFRFKGEELYLRFSGADVESEFERGL